LSSSLQLAGRSQHHQYKVLITETKTAMPTDLQCNFKQCMYTTFGVRSDPSLETMRNIPIEELVFNVYSIVSIQCGSSFNWIGNSSGTKWWIKQFFQKKNTECCYSCWLSLQKTRFCYILDVITEYQIWLHTHLMILKYIKCKTKVIYLVINS
jgi:hypothetical protein